MHVIKVGLGLFFLLIMALLPLRLSQFLGRCLGLWLYKAKSSGIYKISKRNIDCCFALLDSDERERLLKNSLAHTGMSFCEMGMSWLWPTAMSLATIKEVAGEEILAAAFAQGRGVIIIAPHIGNWEVLNLYASKRYALTVLYKPPKLKFFDWLINKMRKRMGGNMAPANARGVRQIMKQLRANNVVAILPDQEPAKNSGKFIPFFKRPAYTMTLLSQLAAKTQAVVICGVATRLSEGGFAVEFKEILPGINTTDIEESMRILNRSIENIVKEYPEQYQWEYKRFSKTPAGLDKLY